MYIIGWDSKNVQNKVGVGYKGSRPLLCQWQTDVVTVVMSSQGCQTTLFFTNVFCVVFIPLGLTYFLVCTECMFLNARDIKRAVCVIDAESFGIANAKRF